MTVAVVVLVDVNVGVVGVGRDDRRGDGHDHGRGVGRCVGRGVGRDHGRRVGRGVDHGDGVVVERCWS